MVLIAINPLTVLLTLQEVCHSAIFTTLQSNSTDHLFVTLLPTLGNLSGSGNTYAALPQNGGVGLGTAFEAAEAILRSGLYLWY